MEGLVALIYKAIKKKKASPLYRSLSSDSVSFDEPELETDNRMLMTPSHEKHKAGVAISRYRANSRMFMTPQRDFSGHGLQSSSGKMQGVMQALHHKSSAKKL